MSSAWIRFLVVAAMGLGLSGCVYPYGYGYYPGYYGPPVVGSVFFGGGGFHRHWR